MEEELKQLKTVLRSLVVSSPSQVDVRSLMRDYRDMMGDRIPLSKFGCRDPVSFLRKHFTDCFLFQGQESNPVLTLIVPDSLKHIDQFVQRQKASQHVKLKGKRRSINESVLNKSVPSENLNTKSFQKNTQNATAKQKSVFNDRVSEYKIESKSKSEFKNSAECKNDVKYQSTSKSEDISEQLVKNNKTEYKRLTEGIDEEKLKPRSSQNSTSDKENDNNNKSSYNAYQSFLKKRMPFYNIDHVESTECSDKEDDYSERTISTSTCSSKRAQLEELRKELAEMILQEPNGIWCTDLLRMYRNRHGRELNFNRFGYTSVLSLACTLDAVAAHALGDDWLLLDARAPPPRPPRPAPRPPRPRQPVDPEDALPFIDFEPDVFPEDCMHFMESIPSPRLDEAEPGAMLEVIVGEVYSPSHFWMIRLGERHNIAMENLMDEMNEYFKRGDGRERRLALGAVRVGHYCSSCYLGDWHRSLIVKVLDSDTVKVRHVDYGTVEPVPTAELRPLLRSWAALPAQAVRARLAAVRPPAAGRRWPHAAAARFLAAVSERRLVANVVARDPQEDILEVLLIDTSTDDDVSIGDELVRSGHADGRADAVTGTAECYLYPRFAALESGDTPNFAEVHAYLRDGIALEYVDDYRRHVPPCLPPALDPPPLPPSPPPPPPSPPSASLTRIPLFVPSLARNQKSPLSSRPCLAPRPAPPTALVSPSPMPRLPTHEEPAQPDRFASRSPPAALATSTLPASRPPPAPPVPSATPVPPAPPSAEERVTLSASDCEVFALLSQVNPGAAQRFMMEAIQRARQAHQPPSSSPSVAPHLNPDAPEFSAASPPMSSQAASRTMSCNRIPSASGSETNSQNANGTPSATDDSRSENCGHVSSESNDHLNSENRGPVPPRTREPLAASPYPPTPFFPAPRYPMPAPQFFLPHVPQYPAPQYIFSPAPPGCPVGPRPGPVRGPMPPNPRQTTPDMRMFFANATPPGSYSNLGPPPGFEKFY